MNRLLGKENDSHEISSLIFSEKKNRMTSATHLLSALRVNQSFHVDLCFLHYIAG